MSIAKKIKNEIYLKMIESGFIKNQILNPAVNYTSLTPYELKAYEFLSINTPTGLCKFLKSNIYTIEKEINNPNYNVFHLAKKRGGKRTIYAPSKTLKNIQKILNDSLQSYYSIIKPDEAFGFTINSDKIPNFCNIAENAKKHTQKAHVLNIDLKDFFPNIKAYQVKALFSSEYFEFDAQVATALTLLTTYKGTLPIGAPTSPVLSNFICLELDDSLKNFSLSNNLTYSRYADDLTFSSDSFIKDETLAGIADIVINNGFTINEKKLHFKNSNQRQTVTGLIVNKKVNIERKTLKKIRAMVFDMKVNGVNKATENHFMNKIIEPIHRGQFIQKLNGYIDFVGQIRGKNDKMYLRLKNDFESVFKLSN